MADLDQQIADLLAIVEQAHMQMLTAQEEATQLFEALNAAIQKVHDSWSGSWAGYHASLYYGDFERPEPGFRFSVEWGVVYGDPADWNERTLAEVANHVQAVSGVSISALEKLGTHAYECARPPYREVGNYSGM